MNARNLLGNPFAVFALMDGREGLASPWRRGLGASIALAVKKAVGEVSLLRGSFLTGHGGARAPGLRAWTDSALIVPQTIS